MNARLEALCALCGKLIEGESVQKSRRGQPCLLHPSCWEAVIADQSAEEARRLATAKASVERSFHYNAKHEHLEQVVGGLPDWPYARLDNPEFRRRASKKIISCLERYSLAEGLNMLISGDTGSGKTGGVTAMMHKWLAAAKAAVSVPNSEALLPVFRPGFFFVTGHELAGARRNWKMGSEAPIVIEAKKTQFLIVDELGFEAPSDLPFEIIDHRYRQRLVTVVTTGRKPNEFRDRYGDAMYRRLTEEGVLLEDFP